MSDTLNTTPRRVLGSLAVNTPTTASKPRNPLSTSKKLAPLSPIGRVCSPPRVGQKRTIDQVEGPSPKSAARRDSPPQTEAREPSIHVYEDVQTIPEPVECTVNIVEAIVSYYTNGCHRTLVPFLRTPHLVRHEHRFLTARMSTVKPPHNALSRIPPLQ